MNLLLITITALAALNGGSADGFTNVVSRTDISDILASDSEIWIAYRGGGVVKYDFRSGDYVTYTTADGLGHNYATALSADEEHIYVATRNGLSKISRETGEVEHTIRMWGYAYNDCTSVAADERYVWLATLEGARRFDKEFGEPVVAPSTWKSDRPLSPQIDDGWTPYVNPGETLLDDVYSVNPGRRLIYWGGYDKILALDPRMDIWQTLYVKSPGYVFVRRVLEHGDDIEIYTSGGAGVLDPATGAIKPHHPRLDGVNVNDAVHFAGFHYIAAADGLYVRRDDGTPFTMPLGTGLDWNSEKDARKRKPSSLWLIYEPFDGAFANTVEPFGEALLVGTSDGVFVFDHASGKLRKLQIGKGLAGPAVYAVLDAGDHLWAATSGGLSRVDAADNAVRNYRNPGGRDWDRLRDLAFLGAKVLAAAEPGAVLFDPVRETWRTFDLAANGLPGSGVCCAVFDDRAFLGTADGLVELDAELSVARVYKTDDGLPSADVVDLAADETGLYIATRWGGLAKLTAEGTVRYTETPANPPPRQILSVNVSGGRVFVGIYDLGIEILTPELEPVGLITRADGLSHTDVWAVALYDDRLWAAVRDVGVNVLKPETDETPLRYYARYGLGDEHCRAITPLVRPGASRSIAFGTAGGLSILTYEDAPPDYTEDDPDAGYK